MNKILKIVIIVILEIVSRCKRWQLGGAASRRAIEPYTDESSQLRFTLRPRCTLRRDDFTLRSQSCASGRRERSVRCVALSGRAMSNSSNSVLPITTVSATSDEGRDVYIRYVSGMILGKGSFGVVYRGLLYDTGERIAIKKILQDRRVEVRRFFFSDARV